MANTNDWIKVPARLLTVNMIVVRQVEPRMEWVPGPYGAFVIDKIKAMDDEFVFTCHEAWGGEKPVKFSYDGDEEVTVVNPDRIRA